MGIHLPPFDASRHFEARAFFRAAGIIWERGKPFDKSKVNERVLRQLYEAHKIYYADPLQDSGKPVVSGDGPDQSGAPAQAASPTASAIAAKDVGGASSGAGAPEPEQAKDPLDHDGDGKKGGSKPEEPATDEVKHSRLMRHTHDELFKMASGLAGVTKDLTKAQIADALVKAGRGPA